MTNNEIQRRLKGELLVRSSESKLNGTVSWVASDSPWTVCSVVYSQKYSCQVNSSLVSHSCVIKSVFFFKPSHPNISTYTRGICLKITTFFSWSSFFYSLSLDNRLKSLFSFRGEQKSFIVALKMSFSFVSYQHLTSSTKKKNSKRKECWGG